jgi:hypothetical protein
MAGILEQNVGLQVLTPMVTESSVFWDTTPCSPLKFNGNSSNKKNQKKKNLQNSITFSFEG